jgi:Flp pilus assembly pilin Flp
MSGLLKRLYGAQHGATAVEYALMAALIALVIFAAVATMGTSVAGLFDRTAETIPH